MPLRVPGSDTHPQDATIHLKGAQVPPPSRHLKSECLEAVRTSEKPRHSYGTHRATHCYLLNFLSAHRIKARERPGTEWGYQALVPSPHSQPTVDKSMQEPEASLALSACLTSCFFNFRWKIRQELTKLENVAMDGSTNLQKGLEKVRRARTTYGCWLSVDYHGCHLIPESPSFLHFLAG